MHRGGCMQRGRCMQVAGCMQRVGCMQVGGCMDCSSRRCSPMHVCAWAFNRTHMHCLSLWCSPIS